MRVNSTGLTWVIYGRIFGLHWLQVVTDFEQIRSICVQVADVQTKSATNTFNCPGCGQPVDGPAVLENQSVVCAACGNQFVPAPPPVLSTEPPPSGDNTITWKREQRNFALKYTLLVAALIFFIWWLVQQVDKQDHSPSALLEKLNELFH
jgi:hypothetical protein